MVISSQQTELMCREVPLVEAWWSLGQKRMRLSGIFLAVYHSPAPTPSCGSHCETLHTISVPYHQCSLKRACRCVPKGANKVPEGGASLWLKGPAAGDQGIDGGGTALWFEEANSRLQLVDDLPVLQPEERLLSHREDLPNTHTWWSTQTWLTYAIPRNILVVLTTAMSREHEVGSKYRHGRKF